MQMTAPTIFAKGLFLCVTGCDIQKDFHFFFLVKMWLVLVLAPCAKRANSEQVLISVAGALFCAWLRQGAQHETQGSFGVVPAFPLEVAVE